MKREYPIDFDGTCVSALYICEWMVSKYDLPCTAEQICAVSTKAEIVHAARLFFAELRAMDVRVTVDPRFNFSVDVTALIKLDQVLSFFRNSNPTHKDADIEQLAVLVKTLMKNIREYDDALRGLSVSTTRSEIQPRVESTESPAQALPAQPQIPPSNPAAPAKPAGPGAPTVSARPPGAPPPHVTQAPPSPPPAVDLSAAGPPPASGAPVPGAPPLQISEDEAVRALAPKDSGARAPGGPPVQKPQNGPPGAPPVAGGFIPPGRQAAPGSQPGTSAAVPGGPPPIDPNQVGGGPAIGPGSTLPATPPRDESQAPPAVPPGAPPPPNPEF